MKSKSGFTIIEIIVVITVIAILSSLVVLTFERTRMESRDAARLGNATIISEALEKYYEVNGEYPSVASIANTNVSNTGAAIASKLSIPANSLVMPKVPDATTNSITSGSQPQNDYIVYVAYSVDDNTGCQNDVNAGCDQFTLRYQEETGDTRVIESRRALRTATDKPDLTVTASSVTAVNASWSTIAGATAYSLQRSLLADMSSPVVTEHASTSTSVTGLTASTTYYFRVLAHLPTGHSEWSDVQSVSTNNIAAPTGTISISAAMVGTNAVGTASGGSCAGGASLERQIRYYSSNTLTPGSWSSYSGGSSRTVAASQGWQYTFVQRARCALGGGYSGFIYSATSSTVRPITAQLTGLTASVSTVGSTSTFTAGVNNGCPTGTTAMYVYRSITSPGYTYPASWDENSPSFGIPPHNWNTPGSTSRSMTWNTSATNTTYRVHFDTYCRTAHADGPWIGGANYASAPPNLKGGAEYYRP